MTQAAAQALAISQTLSRVMREDRGRLLSALVYRLRNFQLAEDVLQEAAISALSHWGRAGLPTSPLGWLLQVALRKAIDRIRSSGRAERNTAKLELLAQEEAAEAEPEMIPDERLRLIFTCCHPALELKSQVSLTLRTLCGLTTQQIAAAFLDNDTTMGQRITRAKTKIAEAGIPFTVPDAPHWVARLNAVLTVVYLVFTTGYAKGAVAGRDLCDEAVFLARLLCQLRPDDAEIEGTQALLLLTHARHKARINDKGQTVALTDQDRSLWDQAMITDGLTLIEKALGRGQLGPFQLKAAISACHVNDAGPDWPQITALYGVLLQFEPTDIVRLNHAIALGQAQGAAAAYQLLMPLAGVLIDYQPFHAGLADVLARLGKVSEARVAYAAAIRLAPHQADVEFLTEKVRNLPTQA